MIDRLREQIQERLDQLVHEADRLRKALAALGPGSSKPPATKPAATEREGDAPKRPSSQPKQAATRRTSTPRSPRRTPPGATKASVLAALAGGEAMTAGEVAKKTGLVPRDRLDDAVEARQDRRAAEGRARLPARAAPADAGAMIGAGELN